jgi:hypothetical protein
MQVGLVLFQAAQQPLGSGDSFFQCNHAWDNETRVSTLPQRRLGASYKLDAGGVGIFGKCFQERANG